MKPLRFFALFFALLAFITAAAKENYQVVLLGDLHYDGAHLRIDRDNLPQKSAGSLNRNLKHWKYIPAMLQKVAAYTKNNPVKFIAQCGDLTHGDEGSQELAERSFHEAITAITKDQSVPLTIVRGNHDVRGKGKRKASNNVLIPYMLKQQVKQVDPQGHDYYRIIGKDLFVFFDGGSLPALEKALAAKPDARHVFVITHVPVLPCLYNANFTWVTFRWHEDKRSALIKMLAKRNAIVLAAHTHQTSAGFWKFPEGTITQLVTFSMPAAPQPVKLPKIKVESDQSFFARVINGSRRNPKYQARLKKFISIYQGNLQRYEFHEALAGFNVLQIDGGTVSVDLYTHEMKTPARTIRLR